jgi:hypothetical protein
MDIYLPSLVPASLVLATRNLCACSPALLLVCSELLLSIPFQIPPRLTSCPIRYDNVYYQKFVKGFAQIATPLYDLLVEEKEWKWEDRQQIAMEEIQEKLSSAPVLVHPDYTKPFIVHTDALTMGLGVVLSQKDS